jgi:NADPH:quinone reductase-like Zn-dependent oxidoreductase
MKAIQMHAFGAVDVLRYEEVERPEPQAGEVLVRVRAAGVNPVDTISRQFPVPVTSGAKGLPYILGWDISGEVVALGARTTQFAVGDKVFGLPRFPGEAKAYSQYTAVPAQDLAHKPQQISHEEAAGVPLAGLTAWQSLFDVAHLEAGQSIFISGASGGVGHYAVQLAKWMGVRVFATTSIRNVALVRDLGADVVIDYTQQDFRDTVKDVDVVLDTIGEDVLIHAFEVVRPDGMVISLPAQKGVGALGERLAPRYGVTFTLPQAHPSGEQMAAMAPLFEVGQLKTHLDAVFPLADVARAHQLIEGGHVRGKVVLTVE